MSSHHNRYPIGAQLVSRFPRGMHSLSYVEATVVECSDSQCVIKLTSGLSLSYNPTDLHREFTAKVSGEESSYASMVA